MRLTSQPPALCVRGAEKPGVLGPLTKDSITPSVWVTGPQGGIREKEPGLGLMVGLFEIWVISGELLNLSEPQFPHQPNGCN